MDKKALRKLAQMKRHELPPLLKAQFDENIRSQLIKVQEPYQKIGMYISINDEADTRRILQHLLDQGAHLPGHGEDAAGKSAPPGLVRLVLEQLRVGHDDGQRGFQLVGGGRDELPLLLPGPLHRAHRPLGEQNADP